MKERLTGAIILVALLVLLVPELLTGPGVKPAAKAAGAEAAQLRQYTIDLQDDANRQPAASVPAASVAEDEVGQATPEDAASQSPSATEVAPPVDDATRALGRPMGSGADPSAAAPEESPPVAVATPGTAARPGAEDDRPRSAFGPNAVTRPQPEKPASDGAPKADTARVAAAKSPEAAKSSDSSKAEAAKAAAAKAEAQKAEAQKAEAAKAEAARVAAAKAAEAAKFPPAAKQTDASKAEAARVAAAKPESSRITASKGWAVQLGVFGSRDNAERLAKQVKGSGFPVVINETSGKDGKKLYWVRVGPEAEQAGAVALSSKLKAAGHKDARVVSYP